MKPLAENIQSLCKARGLSLSRLAALSGVATSTLHGWIQGKDARVAQLQKVSRALQVSIHVLCFGCPDPHEQLGEEILKELFNGDIRVQISKIEKLRK